jgi:tRNA-splicing ligase RtcB (3'-phosphate/5'-hydroxy nucleic acid ligase)
MGVVTAVRGDVDARAVEQLVRCADSGDALGAAICADGHVGYSQPIGGVVAYRDQISPSGVGYDIGCGNKAVKTDIRASDLTDFVRVEFDDGYPTSIGHPGRPQIAAVMDEIVARISFGMGRINDEPVDHPVLDAIANAPFEPQRALAQSAARQLGTVGSGNHYVDLFSGDDGFLWIGVHFGSRGFGHKTASGFLALAEGKQFDEQATEGEMDSPPILFSTNADVGQAYIEAMTLAGAYASAGRDVVVDKVLEILGATAVEEIHNHHNFAWLEEHQGEMVWVVRKGCTPAWPGQKGFVGATMGEDSVILEGVEHPDMPSLLYSTVHGAGRVMSRTQAAGKTKRRKFWECRDCDYTTRDGKQPCPAHGHERMAKRWSSEQVKPGQIDFGAVKDDLRGRGIELRGAAADEAPGAYKRLDEVLAAHEGTVRILHRLTPIGVAMAGQDIYDPFKD